MIPNSHALVPVNEYQHAAVHAVALVESKRKRGKRLAEFPYAKEFFKVLNNGRRQVLSNDIRLISSNYFPDERGGASIAQYIAALDRLIESEGQYSPLPLAGDVAAKLFPAYGVLCRERRERQWDMQYERDERRRSREKQHKRRRYKNQLAQAEVELAFSTPSTVGGWYSRWSKQDIIEDDLVESVLTWIERFPCMAGKGLQHYKSDALWSLMDRLTRAEAEFSETERVFNTLLIPNKLRLAAGTTVSNAELSQS
ncbi:plasmid SOS inhibition protein A [Serratia marcescens]|uniref:plasmid SOS inhibition protein A n=1 Tax=Serratia marcescens TaxID=615 RepID=UPI00148D76ED|nr:plasmid SOS inhibition protein A [Serratia marcescens]QJU41803.1 plasmid SOS inhibition protein A [Serratia marcescens]